MLQLFALLVVATVLSAQLEYYPRKTAFELRSSRCFAALVASTAKLLALGC